MSKTLLLADDSVVIQKLVGLSFANEDVEIIATDNGDDAIIRAREINPDIVLADVVMPGKSGYEVCEAIKQDPDLAHVPVLLLTGTFEAFDEARAAEAGANGQITKPFEAQSLVERVNSVMREAAAGPPVIDVQSEPAASPVTSMPSEPAASALGLGALGADSEPKASPFAPLSSAPKSSAPSLSVNAETETDPSSEAAGYGRRVTDTQTAGLDMSESDFFESESSPQLHADGLDDRGADDFTDLDDGGSLAGTDARDDAEDEVLLNSPGLEISQDLAADFSDSPLAAYVGASSPNRVESPETDFEPDSEPVTSLPPVSSVRTPYGAAATATSTTDAEAGEESRIGDGLGLGDSLPLPDVLTAPPAIDLDGDGDLHALPDSETDARSDSKVESRSPIDEATILVGQDDINASTSPSYAIPIHDEAVLASEPIADVIASAESGRARQDARPLHVHSPSARIDQDTAVAASPADPAAEQGAPLTPPSGVADLDAALHLETGSETAGETGSAAGSDSFSVSASEASMASDALHVGPKSVGGDDLDFAFDVSEQREVTEAELLSEDAEIDAEDISESQIIGRDTSERVSPVSRADDALVGDYDVSSSDLATAASARAESLATRTRNESIDEEADPNASSFSSPLVAPFSSGHYAVGLDSSPSPSRDELKDHDSETNSGSNSGSTSASHPAFAPEPTQTGDDEEIGLASHSSDDRRVSDLSPLMEQRIQETLEKVAWEAFSDLSETIVKQVISRVEQVAWDVIPEMAETLVREEIRRMKGEED